MVIKYCKNKERILALATRQLNADTLTQQPFAKALRFESGNSTSGKEVAHA